MISGLKGNWFGLLFVTALISLTGKISAVTDTNLWSLASPDGQCAITVSLNNEGDLSYEACRAGKIVIQRSPLGLRHDDQVFEYSPAFERAGKSGKARKIRTVCKPPSNALDDWVASFLNRVAWRGG